MSGNNPTSRSFSLFITIYLKFCCRALDKGSGMLSLPTPLRLRSISAVAPLFHNSVCRLPFTRTVLYKRYFSAHIKGLFSVGADNSGCRGNNLCSNKTGPNLLQFHSDHFSHRLRVWISGRGGSKRRFHTLLVCRLFEHYVKYDCLMDLLKVINSFAFCRQGILTAELGIFQLQLECTMYLNIYL